ncbi:PTS system galactose-specific transporter subunit IIB [Streptococcus pneumoniae]|nr:PTS system galactose-specific transporter subunit IIB [Streptococcus pneumoniae]
MIKILAACGAGVNSSHQIKSALEEELSNHIEAAIKEHGLS